MAQILLCLKQTFSNFLLRDTHGGVGAADVIPIGDFHRGVKVHQVQSTIPLGYCLFYSGKHNPERLS